LAIRGGFGQVEFAGFSIRGSFGRVESAVLTTFMVPHRINQPLFRLRELWLTGSAVLSIEGSADQINQAFLARLAGTVKSIRCLFD
jgi:hypothetical protein